MTPMEFVEITCLEDDLLLPWLDLYESAFPPEEKVLVSRFLTLLREKARGLRPNSHMLSALDEQDRLVGLMRFDILPDARLGYLWYLAVDATARCQGVGSACLEEILRRCREARMMAVVFEVETPEHCPDADLARRRIEFYRRRGAKLLTGIRYLHSVGPHQPVIPMHIMVRPFESMAPADALQAAREIFGDYVTQVAELGLE